MYCTKKIIVLYPIIPKTQKMHPQLAVYIEYNDALDAGGNNKTGSL
jgi:hypothetical protein